MKRKEIIKGHVYSNGKGRERKVIDIGPQYKLYDRQESEDNLQYEVVKDGTKKNLTAGKCYPITTASFASWAKIDVTEEGVEQSD